MIVSTLVLRLKAAESFLETGQYAWEHNSMEVQKNRITRWKEQILSGIGEDPDKPDFYEE